MGCHFICVEYPGIEKIPRAQVFIYTREATPRSVGCEFPLYAGYPSSDLGLTVPRIGPPPLFILIIVDSSQIAQALEYNVCRHIRYRSSTPIVDISIVRYDVILRARSIQVRILILRRRRPWDSLVDILKED